MLADEVLGIRRQTFVALVLSRPLTLHPQAKVPIGERQAIVQQDEEDHTNAKMPKVSNQALH